MRHAAILTGPDTHLDHLGVLSSLLKIPLIVTDEKNFKLAQEFYPDLCPELKGLDELSIEHLALNYDVIYETGKFFAAELKPFLKLLFQKEIYFVFCPHGNSDKGHSLKNHVEQDISLVYGGHLHDLLKQTGAIEKISRTVRTGNYRYPYYLKHRQFFDALAQDKVFSHFRRKKPIVLYAPTWSDEENPTTFFTETARLIEDLASSYNLIIKPHPFLIEHYPAHTYRMMALYENDPSALFLVDFPPIYPLLSRCAFYLGDYSSIGYDFLAFDRPLYFIDPKNSTSTPLHSCGLTVPSEKNVGKFLEETWQESLHAFSAQRKKVYDYAFGNERDLELILREITSFVSTK